MDISCLKKDVWSVISIHLNARDLLAFSITNTSFRWLSIIRLTQKQSMEILHLIDTNQLEISNQTKIKCKIDEEDGHIEKIFCLKGLCINKQSHVISIRNQILNIIEEKVYFIIVDKKLLVDGVAKFKHKKNIRWDLYNNGRWRQTHYKTYNKHKSELEFNYSNISKKYFHRLYGCCVFRNFQFTFLQDF